MARALERLVTEQLRELRARGEHRERPLLESGQGPRVRMGGRDVIMLASTNYLGLAEDPRVIEEAVRTLREFGSGTAAGPRLCGVTSLHAELEKEIARFVGTEAALLYTSAYMANLGLIGTLVGRDDIIFSDELNHASIIDGCRFSRAKVVVYPHNDMAALASLLASRRNEGRHALIVADGVFSMDANLAPIPQLNELAARYDAIVVVDDAHGTGVLGPEGQGTPGHFGAEVDVLTSTLGKALGGGVGGFVAGSYDLVDFLIQRSRAYRFTNTLPPAAVATARAALAVLRDEGPTLLSRLHRNGTYLREQLTRSGFQVMGKDLPMVPIFVGDDQLALRMHHRLLEEGVFAQAYTFPAVPRGTGRVRCMTTAGHTEADLEEAVDALQRVGRELGLIDG